MSAAKHVRAAPSLRVRLRRKIGAFVIDNLYRGASIVGGAIPIAHPRIHGLEVIRDIRYQDSEHQEHRLDVWRPRAPSAKPLPVVVYTHGGGFRFMSKESHWLFGLAFARRGYLVVNVNYRLAPRHPFPAAIQDACAAYVWAVKNVATYGGDPNRIVIAGESAGANLATGVAIAACWKRDEPWARSVYDTGIVPRAVLPACGILQVTDPERYLRSGVMTTFVHDRIAEVETGSVESSIDHICETTHRRASEALGYEIIPAWKLGRPREFKLTVLSESGAGHGRETQVARGCAGCPSSVRQAAS